MMKKSGFYTLARSLFVPRLDEVRQFENLLIKHYLANVSIENQHATTDVEVVFTNPNDFPVEGVFIFPLPDGADTVDVGIRTDGNLVEPDFLGKNSLAKFYKSVLQAQDTQILQEIGSSALKVEVLSILAGDECKVQIRYNEFVEAVDENFVYTHHLRSNQPIGSLAMSIAIEGKQAIGTIESLSHDVTIDQGSDSLARITYQATDVKLDKDFVCSYSFTSHGAYSVELLSFEEQMEVLDVSVPVPSRQRSDALMDSDTEATSTFEQETVRISRGAERKLGEIESFLMVPARRNVLTAGLNPPNGAAYHDVFFKGHGTNPFIDTEDDNLSTFGMDADSASYAVTRRYLRDEHLPPPEAVRVEEFINTFDYDYTSPTDAAFAVHLEGASSKFGTGKRLQLLRIGIQGHVIPDTDRKDAVLTFVIDVSGSMRMESRLELVKKALRLLVDQLRPTDKIGIVVYGTDARVVLPHTSNVNRDHILEKIDSLCPEGVTNLEDGLQQAYELASRNAQTDCINRVILCSDGVANSSQTEPESLLKEIRDYVDDGIFLTTIGFGMGNYNDVLMEKLAKKGNGNYAYVDTLKEAKRIFVENLTGTLQVIAKDAKIQVEFNEKTVSRFRLLGYENRRMDHEDFRNDDADAGEIGSGHSVTALYEIKLNKGVDQGKLATVYIRHEDPDTAKVTEVSEKLLVEDIKGKFEDASPDFQFAAAVAQFAEILRESYWAKDGSLGAVQRTLKGILPNIQAKTPQHEEQKKELFHLVRKARELKDKAEAQAS
jgi:Ca-activated chloride channel family protein